jgi:xanthine/uracil permease
MLRGKMGRSRIAKFAAEFFAAEILAWHGEEPLWKVFWVYGVATSVVIVALYIVAFYDGRMALRQVLLPCFAAYTAWILVSVWRCASNTKEALWGTLARFLTVAWAGNTILVLTFLQLNLLIKYLQH